jgi:hypothetical protein
MQNHLVPELRIDKNGKAVNRLVRPPAPPSLGKPMIPAPAASEPPSKPVLVSVNVLMSDLRDGFERNGLKLPSMNADIIREWGHDERRSQLETWSRLAKSFEYRDALYFRRFLSGPIDDFRTEYSLLTAIDSFEFCAAVEDAAPNATGKQTRSMSMTVEQVTNRLPQGALNGNHAGDVCASYFMDQMGFDTDRCFGNKADYYRALEMVRVNLDVIKPQLPVLVPLSAMRKFGNAEELFNVINDLAKYPESAMPLIRTVVLDRGSFDPVTVDAVLGLGTSSISSGIL